MTRKNWSTLRSYSGKVKRKRALELFNLSEHCSSYLQNGDNKSSPNRVVVGINVIKRNLLRTVPEHLHLKA